MKTTKLLGLTAPLVIVMSSTSAANVLDLSNAPVVESGVFGDNFSGTYAFDGFHNTRWAATFDQTEEWIYVDLGGDHVLNSVSVDWESAAATNYTLRVQTEAQGDSAAVGGWTLIATTDGMGQIPGGGHQGGPIGDGFDMVYDFTGDGSVDAGFGGANSIDVLAPTGRYLALHADNWDGQCCNGTSIWEIRVDAAPVPEPGATLLPLTLMLGAGLLRVRGRRTHQCFGSRY